MSEDTIDDVTPPDENDPQPLRIDEAADELVKPRPQKAGEADEDDETWTNQPTKERVEELSEDELDEDEEAEEEQGPQRAPRKAISSGRDVVVEEIPDRAQRAAHRLKPYLTAAIAIEFTNSGERFLFDWREDAPKVTPISKEVSLTCDESIPVSASSESINADTVISISEQHLLSIRNGDLNPQVGMLTEKIKVRGRVSPAVYIFNVVAPRSRS